MQRSVRASWIILRFGPWNSYLGLGFQTNMLWGGRREDVVDRTAVKYAAGLVQADRPLHACGWQPRRERGFRVRVRV